MLVITPNSKKNVMSLIFRISIVRSDIEAHQTGEQAGGCGQRDRAAVGGE